MAEIFTSGRWLQHLWFLVDLLIFSLFALPLSKSVATKTVSGQGWWQGHWLAVFLLVGRLAKWLLIPCCTSFEYSWLARLCLAW